MTKAEAWRKWRSVFYKNIPAGSYDPREATMWAAWEAAWDEATKQSQIEITHLKEQLMRANTNDGAYKAAFLAGQMARPVKTFSGGKPNYVTELGDDK
jgi:hypothetical protein